MIYLLWGKDSFRAREKLMELVQYFRLKTSDLGIFRVESEDFEPSKFEELMKGQTLFEKKHLVVCNKIFENTQAKVFVEKNIEKISETPNVFLFIEDEVDEKLFSLFKEFAKKVQEFKTQKGPSSGNSRGRSLVTASPSPFAICDALAEKNKSRAWLLLQKSLIAGVTAEEIFYRIFWQIKTLLLVKKEPKENGLHPFVVKKNLYALKNFTEKELIDYSYRLLKVYHDARRGLEEFSLGLEKFIINIEK